MNVADYNVILIVIILLIIKHFIIDFPLQTRYQWSNKGTYGHPGGILHAGLHGIGTYLCLVIISPIAAIYLSILDTVLHYHIDWAKMNINRAMSWQADSHEQFWWLLGVDQLLHYLTYVLLVFLIVH